MRARLTLIAAVLSLPLLAAPSMAQTSADPQSLALARQLVEKSAGNRDLVLGSMGRPMVGMMQQMGVTDPEKAQQMVDEAIMPLLREHYDSLVDIQAQSYAKALSATDLKAILDFYNTPAGEDLIKAQPQLTQARVTGLTQWIGALQPEIQDRVQKTAKAHGWTNG